MRKEDTCNSKFTEDETHLTYVVLTHNEKGAVMFNKDYNIPKIDLQNEYHGNISGWVDHLTGKGWASRKMLLELCDRIKKIHPNNTIDWKETLKIINDTNFTTI